MNLIDTETENTLKALEAEAIQEAAEGIVNESRIFGTDGEDEILAPSTGDVQVFGLAGNDILDATTSQGEVILFGGLGNDTLIGDNNHTLYGSDGDDQLFATGAIGGNKLYGAAGNDTLIVVEGSHNELYGGEDNDRLIVSDGGGFNLLYGGEGNDFLDASSGTGNNQLFGVSGHNRLIAGDATDELFGGEGDDQLFAAANGGILTGSGGANIFYVANASIPTEFAVIKDFKPGSDRLVVAGLPGLTGVKAILQDGDTLITGLLSDTEVPLARLLGIQPTALVAGRDVFSQQQDHPLVPVNIQTLDPVDPDPVDPDPVDPDPVDPDPVDPSLINLLPGDFQIIDTDLINVLGNADLLEKLTQDIPDAQLYTPLLSFTIGPTPGSNPDIFSRKIQRVELTFNEIPSETPDYNAFIKLIDGEFSIFDFNPNTGLGAVPRDRDGNGSFDGATLFLKDNGQGDLDPTLGVIRDSAAPSVIGVNQNNPLTVTITDGQSDPLTTIFGTTFKFSVEGSTSSSQVLEAIFGDGTTQTLLTTLGDASGLPTGINSILTNLQSSLGTKDSDGRTVRFQLREVGTNAMTELTIGDVTSTSFTLSGGSFNIGAEIINATNVEIYTQGLEVNGESFPAISLRDLIPSAAPGQNTITIQVEATLYREAAFNNLVGFYLAERTTGAVVDPLTGLSVADLSNRQEYLGAVRDNFVLTGNVANNQTGQFANNGQFEILTSIDLSAHVLLPFLVANGNINSVRPDFSNLYVSGISTNFDRSNQVKLLGNNIFGFEDLPGGGDNDFDDIVVQINGLSLV
ncbi:DUF4114 domain-containing protein [Nodularia spumigena CS-586/05]|uniref:DUF4114 domain-containing protein n=1 Tax=Nodularia spumigena TaxID=70799 RepID=UPI002331496C|nr:DUF4114 domain-containing protein [Nodularia spumigena]MDB9343009.1 DUF4114 domain-containing protein [Nodularia spumigena CS-588/06]MDB9367899.1 DUF4114 domain-containing protein [Nodularia spumigena CS-586/05]